MTLQARLTVRSALAVLLVGIVLSLTAKAAPPAVRLSDLDNRFVDPFLASEGAVAVVFLFASVECPISNRYAPEVRRLHVTFASKGVAFWLVYPNPAESGDAIRRHVAAFAYPTRALRDPQHLLVKATNATVTPEAAVFDSKRRLVYHGRIDNRYVNVGLERPAATKHDLEDVLSAIVAGRPVGEATAPAVGCFIADFVQ